MIFAVILAFSSIQAHSLLENPQKSDFVTRADLKLLGYPEIREALKQECKKRKLDEDFPIELFDEKEPGAWVLALHIARQTVREQRKPKVKD